MLLILYRLETVTCTYNDTESFVRKRRRFKERKAAEKDQVLQKLIEEGCQAAATTRNSLLTERDTLRAGVLELRCAFLCITYGCVSR